MMTVLPGRNPAAYQPIQLISIGLTNKPNIPGCEFSRAGAPAAAVNTFNRVKAISAAISATQQSTGLSHHEAFLSTKRSQPQLFQ
jgi:hypothetical protein